MMLLYEADSKGISASDVLAAQISETDELTTLLVEGVEPNRAQLDEVDHRAREGLDAGTDADDRPHGSADRRVRVAAANPTCRWPSCSTRQWSWPSGSRPTIPAASSTVCCRRWCPCCARARNAAAPTCCLTRCLRRDTYHRDVITEEDVVSTTEVVDDPTGEIAIGPIDRWSQRMARRSIRQRG